MMDPAVRIALALCVLLTGICAAMLFRNERPRAAPPAPDNRQQLLLRYCIDGAAPDARHRRADRSAPTRRSLPTSPARGGPPPW